jgi:hypothetical protein
LSSAHLRKTKKASSEEITVTPPCWPEVPKLPQWIVERLAKFRLAHQASTGGAEL